MAKKKKAAKKKRAAKKLNLALVCDPPCKKGFECRRKKQAGGSFRNVCVPIDPVGPV